MYRTGHCVFTWSTLPVGVLAPCSRPLARLRSSKWPSLPSRYSMDWPTYTPSRLFTVIWSVITCWLTPMGWWSWRTLAPLMRCTPWPWVPPRLRVRQTLLHQRYWKGVRAVCRVIFEVLGVVWLRCSQVPHHCRTWQTSMGSWWQLRRVKYRWLTCTFLRRITEVQRWLTFCTCAWPSSHSNAPRHCSCYTTGELMRHGNVKMHCVVQPTPVPIVVKTARWRVTLVILVVLM